MDPGGAVVRRGRMARRCRRGGEGRSPRTFGSRSCCRSLRPATDRTGCCGSRSARPTPAGSRPRSPGWRGVPVDEVGYAGLKDRHAVARAVVQRAGARRCRRTSGAASHGGAFRVLDVQANSRKLRRGALSRQPLPHPAAKGELVARATGAQARGAARARRAELFRSAALRPRRLQPGSASRAGCKAGQRRGGRAERGFALSAARALIFNARAGAAGAGAAIGRSSQSGRSGEPRRQRQPFRVGALDDELRRRLRISTSIRRVRCGGAARPERRPAARISNARRRGSSRPVADLLAAEGLVAGAAAAALRGARPRGRSRCRTLT